MTNSTHDDAAIRFHGRTRTETKRKALGYWTENAERLSLSLREFLGGCTCSADGMTISFRMPVRRENREKSRTASTIEEGGFRPTSGASGARRATRAIENLARRGERKLKVRAAKLLRRIGVKT